MRASEKGSLSQRFQFLKHLNLFDKLLSGEDAIRQTGGIKRTGPLLVRTVVQSVHSKNEQDGLKKQSFPETLGVYSPKLDTQKDVSRCMWGF